MTDMNENELRLECLKLACASLSGLSSAIDHPSIIDRGRAYADFVLGWDRKQPMQAEPATPESEADPHNPNAPLLGVVTHISPPTT